MPTRNGKIANLPHAIREQLNLRLLEGEPGWKLAVWLNALPEVQSVLASQFKDVPISEVNLTHWRQGGYLQWLTERECFDSARVLAEGDSGLEKAGLSAERLLNILTLRFGELLTRWDHPTGEGESEAAAFSTLARKARILQGISRPLLAIHRLQSQSASSKTRSESSSPTSRSNSEFPIPPVTASGLDSRPPTHAVPEPALKSVLKLNTLEAELGLHGNAPRPSGSARNRDCALPKILSGPISAASLSQIPAAADLAELLNAV